MRRDNDVDWGLCFIGCTTMTSIAVVVGMFIGGTIEYFVTQSDRHNIDWCEDALKLFLDCTMPSCAIANVKGAPDIIIPACPSIDNKTDCEPRACTILREHAAKKHQVSPFGWGSIGGAVTAIIALFLFIVINVMRDQAAVQPAQNRETGRQTAPEGREPVSAASVAVVNEADRPQSPDSDSDNERAALLPLPVHEDPPAHPAPVHQDPPAIAVVVLNGGLPAQAPMAHHAVAAPSGDA